MHRCSSCSAVLFSAETRVHDGQQFGVACCSKGRVVLKPIEIETVVFGGDFRQTVPIIRRAGASYVYVSPSIGSFVILVTEIH